MNALTALLSHGIAERLGWTLLHSVWETALIAAALAIVLRLLARSSAQLRYAAACVAMATMALLPAATGGLLSLPARNAPAAITSISQPLATPAPTRTELAAVAVPAIPAQASSEPAPEQSWREIALDRLESILPYAVGVWLAGVLFFSLRHLLAWTRVQQLRRQQVRPADGSLCVRLSSLARRLGIERAVRLVESGLVQTPAVIGWLRPMILLPASALTGLDCDQLDALLLHELAHIRRNDYLVNLAQTVVEILGFYHPAVWWVSHRIRVERENCCDDAAARALGDNLRYAKALASMEDLRLTRSELALAASGGSLLTRIRRLAGQTPIETKASADAPVVVTAVLLLFVAISALAAMPAYQSDQGRIVRFPADRSVGTLYTREMDFPTDSYEPLLNWQWLGEARGNVAVPAGKALKLDMNEDAWRSGSPFATLQPDDIQMLTFSRCKNAKDSVLVDVARLNGLRALGLTGTAITGEGLSCLKNIKNLRWLFLGSTFLTDEGAASLPDVGSLDYLNLRYTKITDAAMVHVGRLKGLKSLSLEATGVGDQGLASIKDLTSLRELVLCRCPITDAGLAYLAGLTELNTLNLVETRIGDRGLAHLARMKDLRELRLVESKTTGEGLAHLQGLVSLEYLELPSDVDITDEDLAHLGGLNRLKKLYLVSDTITEKGLKSLARLKSLEELDTGGQGITDAAAATIATFPSLGSLWIQRAPLTDEGLAQLATRKSLTKLELMQVNITGAGLAALKGLPALKELFLDNLYIGEGEFSALGDLATLEHLKIGEHIAWSKISFSDRDMACLANLGNLKSLTIVSNHISDEGLRHLSALPSLESLRLSSDRITDAGLKHLEGLRSLRYLSLADTRVTPEAVERLRQAIPGLECYR